MRGEFQCVNIFALYKYNGLFCLEIDPRIEAPCVNGNADLIRSANYETVVNLRIFFLSDTYLLLHSETLERK